MLSPTKVVITNLNSTYLMWLDFNYYLSKNSDFFNILEENGIYVNNGTMYGESGRGFARVNIATDPEEVEKMLNELLKILTKIENDDL